MIIRIDARRLKNSAALHTTLSETFGFTAEYGKNLDALVDCLTSLDDPDAGMSQIQMFPGQMALLVLDHCAEIAGKPQEAQVRSLVDVVSFVNWRRLEEQEPPILAIAYERG